MSQLGAELRLRPVMRHALIFLLILWTPVQGVLALAPPPVCPTSHSVPRVVQGAPDDCAHHPTPDGSCPAGSHCAWCAAVSAPTLLSALLSVSVPLRGMTLQRDASPTLTDRVPAQPFRPPRLL